MYKHIEDMEDAWRKELQSCHNDAQRCAILLEFLCRMVGTTVAATSIGDEAYVDKVCMGIESYIRETAILSIGEIKRQFNA